MAVFWDHFLLLLWKDMYIYQFRRHIILSLIELIFPTVISIFIVYGVSLADIFVTKKRKRSNFQDALAVIAGKLREHC